METVSSIWGFAIAVLYIAVSCGYVIHFRSALSKGQNLVKILTGVTLLAHFLFLLMLVYQLNRLPMASMYEALSVAAFFISLMYVFIHFTSGESGTGVFVFPVAAIFQFISAIEYYHADSFNPILASPFFAAHTIPSIMAYSAFIISIFYSVMYLLMYAQIKSRKLGLFYDRLPSLDTLDSLNSRAVLIGFALLSIGLITGIIWASRAWENISPLDPKLLISYLLWLLYGTIIFLRVFRDWQGKRLAYLSLMTGVILIFSYFVASYLGSSIHRFV